MRTRTLLILATVCGLAILLAGGIQLLRVSGGGAGSDDLAIGQQARAGDLTVRVLAATERDGLMRVEVELGGVDDEGALDDFRLVVPGEALVPLDGDQAGEGACLTVTVAVHSCSLVFGTAEVDGSPRVLLLRRGEDQHRWVLV
ncbi:MAG: hypothetical protein HZB15_15255 [Actinobacteria bacterium]|nr:hypothetical protein [Actinomycetota bacterium]